MEMQLNQMRKGINVFFYKAKYILFFNIKNKVGYVQADLNQLSRLPTLNRFKVEKIVLENKYHLDGWAEIIREAYQNEIVDISVEREKLEKHLFLTNIESYLVLDVNATIKVSHRRPKR